MKDSNRILVVLTTYRREEQLLRFIGELRKLDREHKSRLHILVADDEPESELESRLYEDRNNGLDITYKRNKVNLGQGPNLVAALRYFKDGSFQYAWCPGDDDRIIGKEFGIVLDELDRIRPTAAAIEFRQGSSLQYGTFYEGNNRLIYDLEECIDIVTRFGKGASTIFRYPDRGYLDFLEQYMQRSMYQDKGCCIYALVQAGKDRVVYIHTATTCYGDDGYGKLRYSTRVFRNLPLTVLKTIDFCERLDNISCGLSRRKIRNEGLSALQWWWFGIYANIVGSRSELSYTKRKLMKELLLGWLIAIWFDVVKGDFQPR